jgi:hypothetical protein
MAQPITVATAITERLGFGRVRIAAPRPIDGERDPQQHHQRRRRQQDNGLDGVAPRQAQDPQQRHGDPPAAQHHPVKADLGAQSLISHVTTP